MYNVKADETLMNFNDLEDFAMMSLQSSLNTNGGTGTNQLFAEVTEKTRARASTITIIPAKSQPFI